MPRRPPAYSIEELSISVDHKQVSVFPTKAGVVLTHVRVAAMTENARPLQEFKPLAQQTSRESQRPSTSHGVVKAPRRMSFSRPLTSEGARPGPPSVVPKAIPEQLDTHPVVADPRKIGVAVGSPTQWVADSPLKARPDLARRLPRANTEQAYLPPSPLHDSRSAPAIVQQWKSVGGLFKKKKVAGNTPAPPTLERNASQRFKQESTADESNQAEKQWPARKSSRFRSRSFTKPGESKSCVKLARKPVPPPKSRVPPTNGPWSDFQEQVRRRGSKPQLDVIIPKSEFERYSVMFSELLKKPSPTAESTRNTPSGLRHEAVQSSTSPRPHPPVSNRDRPINNSANLSVFQFPAKADVSMPSLTAGSAAPGTPKTTGYSLFPTVKPSPNPSVNSPQHHTSTVPPGTKSASTPPTVPNPTPQSQNTKPLPPPRNHIISQHASSAASPNLGLGLNIGVTTDSHERAGASPGGRTEPRELRSPDFSPESPVTARSSVSSAWSSRPSISLPHERTESSGLMVGSPGPSVSSCTDTHRASPNDERSPVPTTPALPMTLSRQASLRSHPMHAPASSPQVAYDASSNSQVGVARQVSVTGTSHKPQMLARSSSRRNREEGATLAKLNENASRAASPKMVMIDNSDRPDEQTWLQRRSVWGVIEEGGRVT